ncbi:hypothetical protein PAL_GLEAN10018345 [Pteropus alecto]|uniref:Uncharacterized protein n=1 Tax=Pteropus alecto TaxID=9402 RepID=L5JPP8_PTEAL|nr:hypothetical protein PAL_GLEAN10018345 [Pteropus alecto]
MDTYEYVRDKPWAGRDKACLRDIQTGFFNHSKSVMDQKLQDAIPNKSLQNNWFKQQRKENRSATLKP